MRVMLITEMDSGRWLLKAAIGSYTNYSVVEEFRDKDKADAYHHLAQEYAKDWGTDQRPQEAEDKFSLYQEMITIWRERGIEV